MKNLFLHFVANILLAVAKLSCEERPHAAITFSFGTFADHLHGDYLHMSMLNDVNNDISVGDIDVEITNGFFQTLIWKLCEN